MWANEIKEKDSQNRTINIYNNTSNRIKNLYKQRKTHEEEEKMSNFLTYTKKYMNGLSRSSSLSELGKVLNNEELELIKKNVKNKELKNLFNDYSSFKEDNLRKGLKFEEEFKTFFDKVFFKNKQNMILKVGDEPKNVFKEDEQIKINLEKIGEEFKKAFSEKVYKNIKKVINHNTNIYTAPSARMQKTDILITDQLTPDATSILSLFNGQKLSLKNYQSDSEKYGLKIGLGSTKPYKSIVGVFQDIQKMNLTKAVKYYYSGLYVYAHKNRNKIHNAIFIMRFYYELTGAGLVDENGNKLGLVDYVIINTKDKIIVKHRDTILSELFSDDQKNRFDTKYNAFRDINMYVKIDK